MAKDQQKKPGFFDQLLASVGLKKPEPEAPEPVRPRTPPSAAMKSGAGQQFVRSRTSPAGAQVAQTEELPARKSATAQLSSEEKARQSEERRYLIAAYESTPTLIPEFQNPQYMYKLISNERDYTQEQLNEVLEQRRSLLISFDQELSEEMETELSAIDLRAQELRNDLTRMFLLIKKVAGIQKTGTGGTDFLTP